MLDHLPCCRCQTSSHFGVSSMAKMTFILPGRPKVPDDSRKWNGPLLASEWKIVRKKPAQPCVYSPKLPLKTVYTHKDTKLKLARKESFSSVNILYHLPGDFFSTLNSFLRYFAYAWNAKQHRVTANSSESFSEDLSKCSDTQNSTDFQTTLWHLLHHVKTRLYKAQLQFILKPHLKIPF